MNMEQYNRLVALPIWDNPILSQNVYELPVPDDTETPLLSMALHEKQGLISAGSVLMSKRVFGHKGPSKEALDFLVPVGTPVLAAADGVVIDVQELHTDFGTDDASIASANIIVLDHGDEQTSYSHLAAHSVSEQGIGIGDAVRVGRMIGRTGLSGWISENDPHLHFEIQGIDSRPENPLGICSRVARFAVETTQL